MLSIFVQLSAQFLILLGTFSLHLLLAVLTFPYHLLHNLIITLHHRFHDTRMPGAGMQDAILSESTPPSSSSSSSLSPLLTEPAVFFEGRVSHHRRQPVSHKFAYDVRMAVLSLDHPPCWFSPEKGDVMTADHARSKAGTTGPVRLLTHPPSHGYIQNPISVYYCYNQKGVLEKCIAEVTNTPWGERVSFLFDPNGDSLPKALHVSPFMDMKNTWHLCASDPLAPLPSSRSWSSEDEALLASASSSSSPSSSSSTPHLFLSVRCTHPEHGAYFDALFTAVRSSHLAHCPNESAGLGVWWRYGHQPQRVAYWIYLHAVKLILKRVKVHPPPSREYQDLLASREEARGGGGGGRRLAWRPAGGWPWRGGEEEVPGEGGKKDN